MQSMKLINTIKGLLDYFDFGEIVNSILSGLLSFALKVLDAIFKFLYSITSYLHIDSNLRLLIAQIIIGFIIYKFSNIIFKFSTRCLLLFLIIKSLYSYFSVINFTLDQL